MNSVASPEAVGFLGRALVASGGTVRRVRECSRSYHSVGISAGRYHDAVTVHCAVHPGFPGPEAKKK